MDFTISRATVADLDDLATLFDDYRHFYGRDRDLEGACRFLGERLVRDESAVLLARDGEGPAGFAQLYPAFSSVSLIRTWLLNDLFVAVRCRRQGLGSAMMEAVRDFAEDTGRGRIELETAAENTPAQALYERMGYRRAEGFHTYRLEL